MRTPEPPALYKQSRESQQHCLGLPISHLPLPPLHHHPTPQRKMSHGGLFWKPLGSWTFKGCLEKSVTCADGLKNKSGCSYVPFLRLGIADDGQGSEKFEHFSSFFFISTNPSGWKGKSFLFFFLSGLNLPWINFYDLVHQDHLFIYKGTDKGN